MKTPICPFCGWEVDPPEYEDALSYCRHCEEYVVAEDESTLFNDPDPEIDPLLNEAEQDAWEGDSRNFGVEDDSDGGLYEF